MNGTYPRLFIISSDWFLRYVLAQNRMEELALLQHVDNNPWMEIEKVYLTSVESIIEQKEQ